MVRVEVEDKRGVKGVLIDGYMPDFQYLQHLDWQKAMDEKLSNDPVYQYKFKKITYPRYLKPTMDIPNQNTQSNVHRRIVGGLREKYCGVDQEPCAHILFPSRGYKRIEMVISQQGQQLKDILPTFTREIETDISKGRTNYYFDLSILDNRKGQQCTSFEKCSENWKKFLNFQSKPESTYENFEEYKKAAEEFLQYNIEISFRYNWFE